MTDLRRICVCTSVAAHAEPRGPRHASLLAETFPEAEVTFVDFQSDPDSRAATPVLRPLPNLRWISLTLPTRRRTPIRLLADRSSRLLSKVLYRANKKIKPTLFFPPAEQLCRELIRQRADLYFAHNIETLLPAFEAAKENCSRFALDCMEFYSDMGEGQSSLVRRATAALERQCLPDAAFVTASSPEMATAYTQLYDLRRVASVYNCPPKVPYVETTTEGPVRLYWRNAVIGFGHRGLSLAFDAMVRLPEDVRLHLQGRLPADGGAMLRSEIERRELEERVFIEPPHPPDGAVAAAARFHIGLCLEENTNENHRLTVSNKIFDYMMAGQAVVASRLPALSEVVSTSQAGVTFVPGCADSLVAAIDSLVNDRTRLELLRSNARSFALKSGNREYQNSLLSEKLHEWFDV